MKPDDDMEDESEDGMVEVADALKSIVAALNRNAGKTPVVNVAPPAVSTPAVNVEVPQQRQAKGFTLKIERDSKGYIEKAECTFKW